MWVFFYLWDHHKTGNEQPGASSPLGVNSSRQREQTEHKVFPGAGCRVRSTQEERHLSVAVGYGTLPAVPCPLPGDEGWTAHAWTLGSFTLLRSQHQLHLVPRLHGNQSAVATISGFSWSFYYHQMNTCQQSERKWFQLLLLFKASLVKFLYRTKRPYLYFTGVVFV